MATTHSYQQYCPIAHALDLVGDRWALLIVRDLVQGPKRFTDLKAGLPGIGTNILTDRLKVMERAGVIARRFLPPPAASAVYELTAYGQELDKTLLALAHWGGKTLGPPQAGQTISVDSLMLLIAACFHGRAVVPGAYAVRFEGGPLHAVFGVHVGVDHAGGATVEREEPEHPAVVIATDIETLRALVSGGLTLSGAVACASVRLEGDPNAVTCFIEAMTAAPG